MYQLKDYNNVVIEGYFYEQELQIAYRGHGGRVVTLSPPTSEAGVWFPAWPQVGKLVLVYVLVSSALPTTCRDMTCTVLKAM